MGGSSARLAVLALALGSLAPAARALEPLCTDGRDDDADGFVDCVDPDCESDANCMLRTDRDFQLVRHADSQPFENLYMVSLPERPAIQDVANTGGTPTNKCVNTPGPPAGPNNPDGIINADDVLCTFYGGNGRMWMQRWDHVTCAYQTRALNRQAGGIFFNGTWTAPLGPPEGYLVTVRESRPLEVFSNFATLLGWCDASWPGQVIVGAGCTPARVHLHVPYDILYETADEILCGLEGTDWTDGDADGDPDTCVNGLFDGSSLLTVVTFDNDPTTNPDTDDQYVTRAAWRDSFGTLRFAGVDFPLEKGFSYRLDMSPTQQRRLWHPPQALATCAAAPADAWLYLTRLADDTIVASWDEREEEPGEHGLHAQDLASLPSPARDVLACGLPAGPASMPLVDSAGVGVNRAYLLTTRRATGEWLGADSLGQARPATPAGCP